MMIPKDAVSGNYKEGKKVVILLDDMILDSENVKFDLLPHPRTGENTTFVRSDDGRLFELIKQNKGLQSWFIDDFIEEDGSLYLTSEFDILFMFLPFLIENQQFTPIEDIDLNNNFPALNLLVTNQRLKNRLQLVSDVKTIGDEHVYRYNEEKTLNWCEEKIIKIQKVLDEQNMTILPGSRASTFVTTDANSNRGDTQLYAIRLVSEYLPESIGEALHKKYDFDANTKDTFEEPPAKRLKTSSVAPKEDYSMDTKTQNKSKKVTPLTAAQKKLSKGSLTGMKTMDSFFKKPKK